MSRHAVVADNLPKPVGPFAAAVRSNGHVFLSGQVAQDLTTGQLVAGTAEVQARQVLENIGVLLDACRKVFDDVVRVGIYLTSMADFHSVNARNCSRWSDAGAVPLRLAKRRRSASDKRQWTKSRMGRWASQRSNREQN